MYTCVCPSTCSVAWGLGKWAAATLPSEGVSSPMLSLMPTDRWASSGPPAVLKIEKFHTQIKRLKAHVPRGRSS